MNKKNKIIKNIIFGIGGKIITMALGLIIPRLMLKGYGSEINGLFSTVTNIYTYLAILEAGIGASAIQMLYKPITNNDHSIINKILSSAKKYYQKCSFYYFVGVVFVAAILPYVLSTSITKVSIILVVLIQGFASLTNFYVLAGENVILTADGKEYINSNIKLTITILTSLAKIILVNLQVSIILLQLSYFFISMIQILLYKVYIHKTYPWINNNCYDSSLKLKQRNSLLIGNIVYVIFNNTDTVIISIVCGLKSASVYAVYNLVFTSLLGLINSLFNGLKFTLGQTYNKDLSEYKKLHDNYKSIYCSFVFACITTCYILLPSFIRLYTHDIVDISYVDIYLPLLFSIVNLLSLCRSTESNLITVAFHSKQTLIRSVVEAILNLFVTLILVFRIGIYGCLIGTIVALLYRTNDMIIYANIKILNRKPVQAYVTIISNFALFFTIVFLSKELKLHINTFYNFIIYGLGIGLISILVYGTMAIITNKNLLKLFHDYLYRN